MNVTFSFLDFFYNSLPLNLQASKIQNQEKTMVCDVWIHVL